VRKKIKTRNFEIPQEKKKKKLREQFENELRKHIVRAEISIVKK